MIVVLALDTPQEVLDAVRDRIESHPGLTAQVFSGVQRIVVGVLGSIPPDLKGELEVIPGVTEVVQAAPCVRG